MDLWPAERLGIADRGIREGILRRLMGERTAMSRGGSGGQDARVKTARRRTAQSTRWLERQLNDPYVSRAKAEGYRSRAAYKLIELDERFGFLKGAQAGRRSRHRAGRLEPGRARSACPRRRWSGSTCCRSIRSTGVTILQMDFMDDAAPDALIEALGGAADLVLSDMAANTVGHPQTDALRTMALVEAAVDFAYRGAAAGRRVRRQGVRGRRGRGAGRGAEAQLHDGEARQAAGEPQGIGRMVRGGAGVQGPVSG